MNLKYISKSIDDTLTLAENFESEKLALKVLQGQRALESRSTICIHLYIIT